MSGKLSSIQQRILYSCSIFIVMGIILALIAGYYINQVRSFNDLLTEVGYMKQAATHAQMADQAMLLEDLTNENFMQGKGSQRVDSFSTAIKRLEQTDKRLKSNPLLQDNLSREYLQTISINATRYEESFIKMVELMKRRGFKDYGLEGEMRQVIHELEQVSSQLSMEQVLMMRRHEKDFLLRKDPAYASKLNALADKIKLDMAMQGKGEFLIIAIEKYQGLFNEIVKLETSMGLEGNKGQKGEMRLASSSLERSLNAFAMHVNQQLSDIIFTSKILFVGFCLIMLAVGIAVSVYVSKRIAKPITLLHDAVHEIEAGGNHKKYLDQITTQDETADLAKSIEKMVDRLNVVIADQNKKTEELEVLLAENQRRSWRNDGLNRMSEVINNHNGDLPSLAKSVLATVIKYLNANQGALYVLSNDEQGEPVMEQMACYAYDKQKQTADRLYKGETLVGQCWLEKEEILMSEIPADYVQITSGLGKALPRSLFIRPAIFNEEVVAIIEIASFKVLEQHEIEFVQRSVKNLGSVIANARSAAATQKLLEQTKEMAERLHGKQSGWDANEPDAPQWQKGEFEQEDPWASSKEPNPWS